MHWIGSSSFHGREPETPYRYPAWWHVALALALALLAQATVLHAMQWGGAPPSVVLLVVVWYSVRLDPQRAAILGLLAGLAEDLLSGTTGGSWTPATTLVAIMTASLSRAFFGNSPLLFAALAFFATLVRDSLFWGIAKMAGMPFAWSTLHFHQALRQAILDA
ncbi:MAG TPA: rod shape-determining protein MreD, partial [Candidatus Dormibacteraeota bacterium]|nr:rod shape-determining protein MreD [Candidatus Dormibacteraeota bacterium]